MMAASSSCDKETSIGDVTRACSGSLLEGYPWRNTNNTLARVRLGLDQHVKADAHRQQLPRVAKEKKEELTNGLNGLIHRGP